MKRLIKAAGYSIAGLKAAFASEPAFRLELWLCGFLIPITLVINVSRAERALMIGSLFLVLIAELINTAIEVVVNRIGTEHHHLSGKAKDLGSAVVFLACTNTAVIWAIILL